MAKSLIEELPRIVSEGRREAAQILERLSSGTQIGLQTNELVLPSKDVSGLFKGSTPQHHCRAAALQRRRQHPPHPRHRQGCRRDDSPSRLTRNRAHHRAKGVGEVHHPPRQRVHRHLPLTLSRADHLLLVVVPLSGTGQERRLAHRLLHRLQSSEGSYERRRHPHRDPRLQPLSRRAHSQIVMLGIYTKRADSHARVSPFFFMQTHAKL